MGKYSVDIAGIKTSELEVLSNEDMISLFKELKNGNTSVKDTIIKGNLRLVLSIVQKFKTSKEIQDDLFQIGCIGLIKAVNNFDVSLNYSFSTYAVYLIKGEIRRYIRDNTSLRISRSIKDNAYHILKYQEEFIKENNREPTVLEISTNLNLSEYEINEALNSMNTPISIFTPIYSDGGDTIYLCDKLSDTKDTLDKETLLTLRKSLLKLSNRERMILNNRYVIGKTQEEIAKYLNISQAQVSRIESGAIKHLKRIIK